jgi:hypothetical protein
VPRLRWLIIIPAILFALFAKPAKADTLGEWTYSQSCPTSGSIEVIDNTIILHGPDQGGCAGQAHWVKIETTIPADVDTIDFTWSYQTTDGWVYDPPQYGINGVYTLITQQNNATGSLSVPVNEGDIFTFRQYSIDTCCAPGHLTISNLSLWASITSSTTTTTTSTTTVPSTTVPATNPTTTTVQETTTTTSTSTTTTTTVPQTTTSVANSTSTSSSNPPTTTTQAPTTTTTSTTIPEPTTTSTSTTSVPQTTTTTSSVPQTTSTVSTTTTTQPPPVPTPVTQPQIVEPEPDETVVPDEPEEVPTGTTSTTVEEATPEEMLPEETTTTTEPSPETYPDTTEEPVVDTTLPEAPETPLEAPLSDEEVENILVEAETTEALVEALAELNSEQVEQVVEALLAEEPTEEQATALASSPEVLAVISTEQAAEIFEALDVAELSDTQTEELIAAIESAPTEIREEFEDTIDIFGEGLDDYTPTGSNIPVGERRTLIAVTAGITLAAAGTRIRR